MTGVTRALVALLLIAGVLASACSPEATRVRSGGPGGDIGNRPQVPEIHGRVNPYYETPRYGQASGR